MRDETEPRDSSQTQAVFLSARIGLRGLFAWLIRSVKAVRYKPAFMSRAGLSPGTWGPSFRWMPTGTEAFLDPPAVSELRLCARTHLNKSLCLTRPVGGTYDKNHWASRLESYSGRISQCMDWVVWRGHVASLHRSKSPEKCTREA